MTTAVAGAIPDLAPARAARPQETPEQRQRRKDKEKKRQEQARKEKEKLKQKQTAIASATNTRATPILQSAESQHFTRQTPFICNIRFRNDLPEIPCDPKMLVMPLQPEQLAEFWLTSLELEARHDMPVPSDLGIPISALDIQQYSVPDEPGPLHPDDEDLLQGFAEESNGPLPSKGARTQGKAASVNLSWLMNTTYIQGGAQPAKGGIALKKLAALQESAQLDERDLQVADIEESFDAAMRSPVHQTNPSLTPLEVLPVYPDNDLADQKSVVIQFDGDPAADDAALCKLTEDQRLRLAERCLIKSYNVADESGKSVKFVAFLAPTDTNFVQEATAADDRETFANAADTEYRWIREFNFDVRQEREGQHEYVFRFQKTGVFYTVLGPKLTLRKRSKHKGVIQDITRPSKITIRRRRRPDDALEGRTSEQDVSSPRPTNRQRTGLSSSDEEDAAPNDLQQE